MTRSHMMRQMVLRSLRLRRGRTLIALSALTLAATLITAMLSLYADLESKLDKEFRSYGANIIVAAHEGHSLPNDTVQQVQRLLGNRAQVVSSALVVANAVRKDGTTTSIAVIGTDLAAATKLNSWWKLESRKAQSDGSSAPALFGKHAEQELDPAQTLTFEGRQLKLRPIGIIESGGPEEDRVYISQQAFERWTGLAPNLLEISYTGSAVEIRAALEQLNAAFAGQPVEVRPVRKIVEAEGRVIRKTRAMMLACGLLIALTVALCVGSTLTASVLERRRDFALMKALGASQQIINGIFTAEAALLGIAASLIGFPAGIGLANLIGTLNFHASIMPRVVVFPTVLLITILVGLASALLPLMRLQRLEPAVILKGD